MHPTLRRRQRIAGADVRIDAVGGRAEDGADRLRLEAVVGLRAVDARVDTLRSERADRPIDVEIGVVEHRRRVVPAATNAAATGNALACYVSIYWIAGGRSKEGGIESLSTHFPDVKHAFLIGEATEEFAATLAGRVAFERCGTLDKALERAQVAAVAARKPGAVVLLSPACASWDQWKSYEHRGDAFRAMARALPGAHSLGSVA